MPFGLTEQGRNAENEGEEGRGDADVSRFGEVGKDEVEVEECAPGRGVID